MERRQDMKKHLTIFFSALEHERLLGMLCRNNPSTELMRRYMEAKEATVRYRLDCIKYYENETCGAVM
jgi:hypothetical protein